MLFLNWNKYILIDGVSLNQKLSQRTQESKGAATADILYIRGNLL